MSDVRLDWNPASFKNTTQMKSSNEQVNYLRRIQLENLLVLPHGLMV